MKKEHLDEGNEFVMVVSVCMSMRMRDGSERSGISVVVGGFC